MKIVIDISEAEYHLIKKLVASGGGNRQAILILGGTVLPKGHGRLYDEKVLHDYWGEKYDLPHIPCIIEADKENEND